MIITPRNAVAVVTFTHKYMYRSGRHEDTFSSHPLRYLWVNDYKGNGISVRDHYIFCSSVMLGIACAAEF